MAEKITVSCGNVFEDLGFAPDEAAAMQARETLLIALEKELRKRGKKQPALAQRPLLSEKSCFNAIMAWRNPDNAARVASDKSLQLTAIPLVLHNGR